MKNSNIGTALGMLGLAAVLVFAGGCGDESQEARLKDERNAALAAQGEAEKALGEARAEIDTLRGSTALEVKNAKGELIRREPLKIAGLTAVRHGEVLFIGTSGHEFRIKYADGKLVDQTVFIRDPKGVLYCDGPIVNGMVHGLWTMYEAGKPRFRIEFADGQIAGLEIRGENESWRAAFGEEMDFMMRMIPIIFSTTVDAGLAMQGPEKPMPREE